MAILSTSRVSWILRVAVFVAGCVLLSSLSRAPGVRIGSGLQAAGEEAKPTGKATPKTDGEEGAGGAEGEGKAEGKKAPPTAADKEKEAAKKVSHDLETWGQIKPVKGTEFWTFSYVKIDKGRAKKETAFVKITEEAQFYKDKVIPVTELKEGDSLWLVGKLFEQEAPSSTGFVDMDRQFKNVSAVVLGEGISVNTAYKDPRDAKIRWFEGEVAKAGPSISVTFDANVYKVVMVPGAAVLKRDKDGDLKSLKGGMNVALALDKSEERPETKSASDAKKESFVARSVVLMDPRLMKVYPMLFE